MMYMGSYATSMFSSSYSFLRDTALKPLQDMDMQQQRRSASEGSFGLHFLSRLDMLCKSVLLQMPDVVRGRSSS